MTVVFIKDYYLKATRGSPGADFFGDPVQQLVSVSTYFSFQIQRTHSGCSSLSKPLVQREHTVTGDSVCGVVSIREIGPHSVFSCQVIRIVPEEIEPKKDNRELIINRLGTIDFIFNKVTDKQEIWVAGTLEPTDAGPEDGLLREVIDFLRREGEQRPQVKELSAQLVIFLWIAQDFVHLRL